MRVRPTIATKRSDSAFPKRKTVSFRRPFPVRFLLSLALLLSTFYFLLPFPALAQTLPPNIGNWEPVLDHDRGLDIGNSPSSVPLDFSLPSFFPFFIAPRSDASLGPVLSAKAAFVYDLDTNEILFTKNITQRLPIASLTKLMTMTVVLESGIAPQTPVVVPLEATKLEPAKLYLLARDALTVRDLVFAGLVSSANDAAFTLATVLPDIISVMNKKAHELGLADTRFANSTGLDQENNFSTAVDVSRLLLNALTHPLVLEALHMRRAMITSALGKSYTLDNTNILLGSDIEIIAGKTGTTDDAGQCLINIARLKNGHRILTVVLGSRARFTETKALLRWVERGG